jgi:hypothetical protein
MADALNSPSPSAQPGAPAADQPPSPEVLKAALKAFRKRLKVTRLDHDSRIGRGPMSSGQTSIIDGITAPDQYPRSVWEELVKQGKLKHSTHGMYSLP